MKKKVLLLMPSYSAIHEVIVLNLEKMGYEVTYRDVKLFKYKGIGQKLYNFFRKTVLKDKDYKDYLKKKFVDDDIREVFKNSQFDYALVIRPDTYLPETIYFLRKIAKIVIGYQWDGFSRFRTPSELIDAFDVFGVFDKIDYQNNIKTHPNLRLTHNFYFDFLPIIDKNIDLFYVGADQEGRILIIEHLIKIVKNSSLNNFFRIYANKQRKNIPFVTVDNFLPYKKLLQLSAKAKCIIDIKNPCHNGLSLRFFEALYFNQKIITDNETVKDMDFYNPNNILVVTDFKSLTKEILDDFLRKKYIGIPKEIKQKYSFENWFNTIIKK